MSNLMLPWPRRADIPATKPYTLNYPEFCCATGNEDFFDNNLVRCMFGAVCKKQISEQDFQSKLAELWGANPQIPIYQAEWENGNVSYILAPGDWDIRIPYSWPDFPKYMECSDYNNCKKYHGMQANNWTGVGALGLGASNQRYNEVLDTDIAFPVANYTPHTPVYEITGPGICEYIEPSNDVKPYYYVVQPGDTVYTVSRVFLPGARNRWEELREVNYLDNFTLQQFVGAEGNTIQECFWHAWRAGQKLRIPAGWPDPDWASLFPGQTPPIEPITEANNIYLDYEEKMSQVKSGLAWGLAIGGIFTVALVSGIVVLIRRSGRS